MAELTIVDGEPIDIVADASLDGAGVEGKWQGDEFHVAFRRDGKVIAGFNLGEEALRALNVLLSVGLSLCDSAKPKKEKQ